jgi:RNA polymerase sigma-70 factor, ECF subfamily
VDSEHANRLARICAYSDDPHEWERFVHAISRVVAIAARRVGMQWGDASAATVSEIVQEVFLKLCEDHRRVLREFEDRGNDSFLKLLRMITNSVGTDHFRRMHAEKRGGGAHLVSLEPNHPALDVPDVQALRAMEWSSLVAQLDGLLRLYPKAVKPRDRHIFWLYYRQGMTADAISRIPTVGLTAKGVESALLRLTRLLREAVLQPKVKTELASAAQLNLLSTEKRKGFSPAVAIDSVRRR